MAFELRTFGGQPGAALLDGCVAVYRAAFGAPPYGEPPERADGLRDRVVRYAARDGFRLPVALEATSGEVAGFGLAVRAYRGDWWRDAVAAAAGPQIEERWLGDACLEVVHLAVAREHRRRGLGARLLSALVEDAGAPTGVLTVHPAAAPAQRLYLAHGWSVVTRELELPGAPPVWLLGRAL